MIHRLSLSGFAGLLLLADPAAAQIATDRPGFGYATSVVPGGAVQLELGTPFAESSTDAYAVGLAGAARVGLAPRLELRLGTAWYADRTTRAVAGDLSEDGVTDLDVGVKVQLIEGGDGVPALVFVPTLTLPTGSDGFTADRPAFDLATAAGWTLSPTAGLTTVASIAWNPDGEDDYATSGLLVAVLGTSFGERWGGYVETAWLPGPTDDGAYAGGGLTFALSERVQRDGSVDRAVAGDGTDWLYGLGTSLRF